MNGTCPVCDAQIEVEAHTIVTEIVPCSECSARLVVEEINGTLLALTEAPAIEEDWGQ